MKNCYLAFLFFFFLFFSGCHKGQNFKIGVSQCSDDDWRKKMNDEIEREIMFHPELSVEILSADDNNDKQIEDIRYFIENKFDIIVAAPNEAEALTPIISEAFNKGIPVLLFDRKVNGNDFTAFQGVDNDEIGKAVGEYISKIISDKAKIIEIQGLSGSSPAISRHEGFIKEIEGRDDIEITDSFYGNWNYEDTYQVIDSLLSHGAEFDIVYAHNDRMAIAASDALKKRGLKKKIIGIDGAPEIGMKAVADGVIDATFLYPTDGQRLIRTALAILKNEPYDSNFMIPVSSPIDISNASLLLQQNAELEEETARMEVLKTQIDKYWEQHNAQGAFLTAVIIILILSFTVIFFVLRAFWSHKRHRDQLAVQNNTLERQKNELISLNNQLNEATQAKIMFFTNVSHDLKTPLTLISEPVEQLTEASNLTGQQKELMRIANKNVRILKRLINQILDFRKYENNKMPLNLTEVNLSQYMNEWVDAFKSISKKRHINLTSEINDNITLAVDLEKIERIFFNILSNAFKYTPDNGAIKVSLWDKNDEVCFSVKDTGRGIAEENIGKIFDQFYQVESINPQGSGIGLALTKAFVELHQGTIEVESELKNGSVFTVKLPLRHVENTVPHVDSHINEQDIIRELDLQEGEDIIVDNNKPLMLIIDDNEDIRSLISSIMGDSYNVITADNGMSGLKMASKYVPDIIICDVMMPVMDGLECCRRLKEELSTSHIPVIMLTSCSMDEQKIMGYESGADGYVAKPFNSEVLKSQCKTTISNRIKIKNASETTLIPREKSKNNVASHSDSHKIINGIDNEFYNRFIELVNDNMGDASLNVDKLATELGLARSQFYRKIKALTNFSPVELLRQIRLKRARILLNTTEKSISEIGYEVGFSSAAYFTKCYKDEFGETPSQLRERLGHKV